MTLSVKYLKDSNFKKPIVMLLLKQYQALMEYMELTEDLFDIRKRENEPNIPHEVAEKKFKKKFKLK